MSWKLVGGDGEESYETLEDVYAAQAPWTAYLVTVDGEFVEIGQASTQEEAEDLRHEYFLSVLEEDHPHRFFKIMGVTSRPGLEYVRREHC